MISINPNKSVLTLIILIMLYTTSIARSLSILIRYNNCYCISISGINRPINRFSPKITTRAFPKTHIRSVNTIPQGDHRVDSFSNAILDHSSKRGFYASSNIVMMPEGPEVRTVSDGIGRVLRSGSGHRFKGMKILSGRYTRHEEPKGWGEMIESLNSGSNDGVEDWKCKGKFQYLTLADGERSIWITLGMSGKFEFVEDGMSARGRHGRVEFEFEEVEGGGRRRLVFDDARNFGTVRCSMTREELEKKLKTLGPDILEEGEEELTGER